MTLIFIFTTAFITGLSGAIVPGPLLSFTVAETLKRGFRAAPLTILGHAILELSLILAILGGLSVYLKQQAVFHTIALLGGFFLLLMGLSLIRDGLQGSFSAFQLKTEEKEAGRITAPSGQRSDIVAQSPVASSSGKYAARRGLHPVAGGILISLANPYWSLWWLTIGLGYLSLALKSGSAGVLAFFSGHILADLAWYSLVAAAICGGRKVLNNSIFRALILCCGVFLLALGSYFMYLGIGS
ncbi:MAG: LysE family transporter [Syntrophomonas sp.]|uniref:LysE family transporter n=1 Tax=Syntrophomonas sp. TaxID=2053627 RepID=UPI0026295665|nr:LysE family transporter [Syntrophomonas sp.]MDD2510341.1 LysE family transporter [Syntrophomonas sp.]MDD3878612.1 LysE family transporter [Syntrophomonas sp.]MDD4627494.1 LysE family transporter [Syntrophomonas sp.]